jgi:hypothetical protein
MYAVFAFFIFLLSVVVVFLVFQVQTSQTQCKDLRSLHQDQITRVARLLIQSATQNHPLLALEHAVEAKVTLDHLVQHYGGVSSMETQLKKTNEIEVLKMQVDQRYSDVMDFMMKQVLQQRPDLDWTVNETAGLQKAVAPGADTTTTSGDATAAPASSPSRKKRSRKAPKHG